MMAVLVGRKLRSPQPRYVEVTFTVPGLDGAQKEIYDMLSVADQACWRANTQPPAVQLFVNGLPERGMLKTKKQFKLLDQVSAQARQQAKEMRKVRA